MSWATKKQDEAELLEPGGGGCSEPVLGALTSFAHVFVDASNISYSAKQVGAEYMPDVRVDIAKLAMLLDEGHCVVQRAVAGSSLTPASVWTKWRMCGYATYVDEVGADHRERNVDALLQRAIHSTLDDPMCAAYRNAIPARHTLVLATGDGTDSGGETSFPALVHTALEDGWAVDLWCWESAMNAVYGTLQSRFPAQMRIRLLDAHRDGITFSQIK